MNSSIGLPDSFASRFNSPWGAGPAGSAAVRPNIFTPSTVGQTDGHGPPHVAVKELGDGRHLYELNSVPNSGVDEWAIKTTVGGTETVTHIAAWKSEKPGTAPSEHWAFGPRAPSSGSGAPSVVVNPSVANSTGGYPWSSQPPEIQQSQSNWQDFCKTNPDIAPLAGRIAYSLMDRDWAHDHDMSHFDAVLTLAAAASGELAGCRNSEDADLVLDELEYRAWKASGRSFEVDDDDIERWFSDPDPNSRKLEDQFSLRPSEVPKFMAVFTEGVKRGNLSQSAALEYAMQEVWPEPSSPERPGFYSRARSGLQSRLSSFLSRFRDPSANSNIESSFWNSTTPQTGSKSSLFDRVFGSRQSGPSRWSRQSHSLGSLFT